MDICKKGRAALNSGPVLANVYAGWRNLKPGRRATRIIGCRNVALFSLSGVENRIWRGSLCARISAHSESGSVEFQFYSQRICCS